MTRKPQQRGANVITADRSILKCSRYGGIKLDIVIAEPVDIDALIVEGQLLEFDILLGIDAIREHGGAHITWLGKVHFLEGNVHRCVTISIDDPDFSVKFDPHKRVWTASWKWANGQTPAVLKK